MNAEDQQAGGTAAMLREAFDRGFTEVAGEHAVDWQEFVQVEAGGQSFALAMEGMAGLEKAGTLLAVPSRHPALAGVAVVRGVVVPVFRAEVLLGLPGGAGLDTTLDTALDTTLDTALESGGGRRAEGVLFALVAAEPSQVEGGLVGIGFDALGMLVRVAAQDVVRAAGTQAASHVTVAGVLLPVLDARALAGQITGARGGRD